MARIAAKQYQASRYADSSRLEDLQAAVRLQPDNPDYQHRLGIYELIVEGDARAALPHLQAATVLAPHMAGYWLSLATAYNVTNEADLQRTALISAAAAEPVDPGVNWSVANFFLVRGDTQSTLLYFRRAFAGDPSLIGAGTAMLWRVYGDAGMVLSVLPPTSHSLFAFLENLLNSNAGAAADQVWDALISGHYDFDPRAAMPYINWLLANRRVDRASWAWDQVVAAHPDLSEYKRNANLVTNGDFAHSILNGGFDWRYTSVPGLRVSISSADRGFALQFEFLGDAIGDCGISQVIPVSPATDYILTSNVKTESLIGAGSPRFEVRDYATREVLLEGDDLRGTFAWQQHVSTFRTGQATRLIELRIVRPAATGIRGVLWLDDIDLRSAQAK